VHLIFVKSNNSRFRRDATGAFIPEAKHLESMLVTNASKVKTININTRLYSMTSRQLIVIRAIKEAIRNGDEVKSISFFCHGWPTGLQLWGQGKAAALDLAHTIQSYKIKMVNLYACSCASQKRGKPKFLNTVWGALCEQKHDCQLMGHHVRGHTTRNPRVEIYFSGDDGCHYPLFEKKADRKMWARWRKKLRQNQNFRVLFPYWVYRGLRGENLLGVV